MTLQLADLYGINKFKASNDLIDIGSQVNLLKE